MKALINIPRLKIDQINLIDFHRICKKINKFKKIKIY